MAPAKYLDTYNGPVHHYQSPLRPITQLPLERLGAILDTSTFRAGDEDPRPASGWDLYTALELDSFTIRQFTLVDLGGWIATPEARKAVEWGPGGKADALHDYALATAHYQEICAFLASDGVTLPSAIAAILQAAINYPEWARTWVEALEADTVRLGAPPRMWAEAADELRGFFPVSLVDSCPTSAFRGEGGAS